MYRVSELTKKEAGKIPLLKHDEKEDYYLIFENADEITEYELGYQIKSKRKGRKNKQIQIET